MQFHRKIILYFSPTGGTRRVAELLAKEFETEHLYDITVTCYDMTFAPEDLVVVCFPVYSGRMPKPLKDRFASIHAERSSCIPVAVFGNNEVGDALLELSDTAAKSGFTTVGGLQVVTRHSLNMNVGAGRPDEEDRTVIREFVRRIREEPFIIPVRMPGHRPYRPCVAVPVLPYAGLSCMLCCTCAKECPAGAINGPKVTNYLKCIGCMRCVTVCPSDNRKVPLPARIAAETAVKALTIKRQPVKYYL